MRIACVTLTICLLVLPANAKYSGGSGEPNDPYQIATAADLVTLGETPADYDRHFLLTADIDLDPNLPGGKMFDRAVVAADTNDSTAGFQGDAFAGTFDGHSHVIRNLVIHAPTNDFIGLFGYMTNAASVKDLNLEGVDIASGQYVGGLAGYSEADLSSCSVRGTSVGSHYVGGLVGYSCDSRITLCSSDGTVKGTGSNVGGLVGFLIGTIRLTHVGSIELPSFGKAQVDSSSSTVVVEGHHGSVGGLIGAVWHSDVVGSFSSGNVIGNGATYSDPQSLVDYGQSMNGVGGLVGSFVGGMIVQCYSTGAVTGKGWSPGWEYVRTSVGGLVGWNSGHLDSCYSTGTVTGAGSQVGGLVGWNGPILAALDGRWYVTFNNCIDFCYATGKVTGTEDHWTPLLQETRTVPSHTGGLIGLISDVDIWINGHDMSTPTCVPTACFWDTEASGTTQGFGVVRGLLDDLDLNGVVGKTTAEMQTGHTFLDAGWDFVDETANGTIDIWQINEGKDYPRLSWEDTPE